MYTLTAFTVFLRFAKALVMRASFILHQIRNPPINHWETPGQYTSLIYTSGLRLAAIRLVNNALPELASGNVPEVGLGSGLRLAAIRLVNNALPEL